MKTISTQLVLMMAAVLAANGLPTVSWASPAVRVVEAPAAAVVEEVLRAPGAIELLSKHPEINGLAARVMGTSTFEANAKALQALASKLQGASGNSAAIAVTLVQELKGRTASAPVDPSAQKTWLKQQLSIPVGSFVTTTEKTAAPAAVAKPTQGLLSEMMYAQLARTKAKEANASEAVLKQALAGRGLALKLGWVGKAHDKCLGEFTHPVSITAVLYGDGATAEPGVKALPDVRKVALDKMATLYPGESKKSILKNRICPAMSVNVNPECDVFNWGAACGK